MRRESLYLMCVSFLLQRVWYLSSGPYNEVQQLYFLIMKIKCSMNEVLGFYISKVFLCQGPLVLGFVKEKYQYIYGFPWEIEQNDMFYY